MTLFYVAIGISVLFLVVLVLVYNTLVYKRNVLQNTFASIDVMLKKRYDLIPNLVQTVKGYAEHEQEVLVRVTELRNRAAKPDLSDDEKIMLDARITGAMGRLMAVVENYPDLKADTHFLQLQRTITEIEEQISAARRAFNAAVTDYNNSCMMFPTNIAASVFGFSTRRLFEIPDVQKRNLNVSFHD